MKLSKMEQRLLNVMGGEYVGSAILMDRLYAGLRRPKSNTISAMISRLRAKGVKLKRSWQRLSTGSGGQS